MQCWNHIINTALLGTGKKPVQPTDFPEVLREAAEKIMATDTLDREDQLLQLGAIAFNYRQSGVQPVTGDVQPLPLCAEEDKAYCPDTARHALHQALDTNSQPLIQLWLDACITANLLAPPDDIPLLLDSAFKQKALRNAVAICCGKRGEWLAQFNSDWRFSVVAETPEEYWQNGTTQQRTAALKTLRSTDPDLARTWLQDSWPKESAAVKTELLTALYIQPGAADIPWLQSLLTEKSKQVKETVVLLLKKIPGSDIHEQYWQLLTQAITVTGTSVTVALPERLPEAVLQSGIQPLSPDKQMTDATFILDQLIQRVHPAYWATHFSQSPADTVLFFREQATLQPFLPSLAGAAAWFEDEEWATALVRNSDVFYTDLLPLLPVADQQLLCEQHFELHAENILPHACRQPGEWSLSLCEKILQYCARHPYSYNQTFMNNAILQIPVAIAPMLEKIAPDAAYQVGYWQSIRVHLEQLINTKSLIINTFKSLLPLNN
ncbi:DUF5691 domain-containing protein [Chitinophaga nivalis]|uniref:DUF5691 domain-containing protein n=1 Tax=Chitinophaga nivalis TaxID=2991709 RepID=A0ABT3IIG1_9BACT|nr:DUF5691 domain-containing protein [Chitinophaga nivalis]MCW3466561.1 DUF5691 domain-containing protein [Chitinophaga nivalis]MCW3483748.1 DUF5691 domain-containing protein [Chitinophaga nivalis]